MQPLGRETFQVTLWIFGLICLNSLVLTTYGNRSDWTCPDGWILYNREQTCFWFPDDLKGWLYARQTCQDHGSELAVITNARMNRFFIDKVLRRDYRATKSVYIGLNDLKAEGSFRWLDDDKEPKFTFWGRSYPQTYGYFKLFDCVVVTNDLRFSIRPQFGWSNVLCGEKLRYVCQQPARQNDIDVGTSSLGDDNGLPVDSDPPVHTLTKCPSGWFHNPRQETCISISKTTANWANARIACQQDGGDLVVIKDAGENAFVTAMVLPLDTTLPYWIGLHKVGSNYNWLDETTPAGYTSWGNRYQPDKSKQCTQFQTPDAYWRWFTEDCEEELHFICERLTMDLQPPISATSK